MDLAAACALAHTLLGAHPELSSWTFTFDNATRRMGVCNYPQRRISISRLYTAHATEAQVRDTIQHEIAHALTPGAKHGPVWKAKARALGATARACGENPYTRSTAVVQQKLAAVDGQTYYRVNSPRYAGQRFRVLRDNTRSYTLVDDEGVELRADKPLVYLDGSPAPTREQARDEARQENLAAVRGLPVVHVNHRSYRDKRYSVLKGARGRGSTALLVDLETGRTLRCPPALITA